MNIKIILLKILAVSVIITHLNSCGFYRPVDAREFPPEPEKRIQKNLEEGRGFRLMDLNKNKGGDFSFASSNEMWRASLDILNFMPLTSADYGGGLIITDWYSEQDNSRDSIKISVRFLSNEIRADGLEIVVFSKKCDANINCKVIKNNSEIESELKIAILKRAAKYKKEKIDKNPKRSLNTIKAPEDNR
jgi:hypothetical protein